MELLLCTVLINIFVPYFIVVDYSGQDGSFICHLKRLQSVAQLREAVEAAASGR